MEIAVPVRMHVAYLMATPCHVQILVAYLMGTARLAKMNAVFKMETALPVRIAVE
jgi:hypothetical protein